jgi:oxygen-independent coproporphyrinogen-3 oxidase
MDHFAKPDDELAIAQETGTLYRNFQGYSTHAECDLVGMGVTAISMVGDSYWQNLKTETEYSEALDADQLAVFRGLQLNDDDRLRRVVIMELICHFHLEFKAIEQQFGITFSEYFAPELEDLGVMREDGLLDLTSTGIQVRDKGILLIRNICMVFDIYARRQAEKQYSKVI